MPVQDNTVLANADDSDPIDPAALRIAESFLETIGFPRERKTFTPAALYELFSKRVAAEGGEPEPSIREWQRRCERGELCAVRPARSYHTTREWLIRHLAARQTAVEVGD